MQRIKQEKTKENRVITLYGKTHLENPVLVIGVVHGDEPQGEELINRYLNETPDSNILFIPCLNPDGKANNTRVNANKVDINRNFPAKNWEHSEKDNYFGGNEPASEIETKFLTNIIEEYKPKLILTLHTPYKIVNYDGPAKEIAEKISEIIGYPVEESIGYPTPGSFGTYAGIERNIPVITLEMDEERSIDKLYPKVKHIFLYLEKL